MKNKISINIIGKCPPPLGGVTIHTLRLYQWLSNDPTVSVKFTTVNENFRDDPNIKSIKNNSLWILRKLFMGFKSDIVHYQGANYYGLIILYVIYIIHGNFKLVLSIHGEGYIKRLAKRKIFNIPIYYILGKLDLIIASGEHLKIQLLSVNVTSKISVIDPFLMPIKDDVKGYPHYVKEIINSDKFLICANAFNIDKIDENSDLYGLHLLSKVSKKLNYENADYTMIILIANINDREYVDKLFLGIKNVYIVSDENINGWQVIADSDLMIRPTSTDGDALSIKEALSSGVDVIASDVTPRNENVIVFNYNDIDDLYKKVLDKIKNPQDGISPDKNCIENSIVYYLKNYKILMKKKNDN